MAKIKSRPAPKPKKNPADWPFPTSGQAGSVLDANGHWIFPSAPKNIVDPKQK